MTRKRRMFDISMPEDTAKAVAPLPVSEETFPAGKDDRTRRGPMAAAISETVQSARERNDLEAQIRAENDALAHEYVRLKQLGLVIEQVPLDLVDTYKLTRDRAKVEDPELAELMQSVKAIGLSNPIRLEARADGRYELVQGFRRLSAYRKLLAETGDAVWAKIPAAVAEPGEALESLYRRMVDENLVRKDISFAEMAQLAIDYAADPQTAETDPDKVVAQLFSSANYQKRSYIRNFIRLIDRIGPYLSYAYAIPRALGLALVSKLEVEPQIASEIKEALADWDNHSEKDELDVLRRIVGGQGADLGAGDNVGVPSRRNAAATVKAKTSFQIDRKEGRAKCTAANGRLEIRLARDFTVLDRRRLEQAVRLMLDQLE